MPTARHRVERALATVLCTTVALIAAPRCLRVSGRAHLEKCTIVVIQLVSRRAPAARYRLHYSMRSNVRSELLLVDS